MLRRVLIPTFMFIFFTFLLSCGGGGGGSETGNGGSFGNNSGGNNNFNNPNNNVNINPQNATFLAIYMVGSDLESQGGAGTEDLKELINGYSNLTQQEKNNVYIYVAFGGADADGWRGVKYADISCLIKDAADKKFGNDNCYEYVQVINTQNLKDMGDQEALEHFLNTVKNKANGFSKKILVLWNHGGAFIGYGWDENWKTNNNIDFLNLKEIKNAFKNTGAKFDIIGFDACLMANLEVAVAVKNYGDYLLASEETEPGHGWHYTDVINIIAKNPSSSSLDIAKQLVDSYINNPNHAKGSGLTLSVIDLSKVDAIVQEINSNMSQFGTEPLGSFINAEKDSEKFGFRIDKNLEVDYYTADAITYFEKLGFTSIKNKLQEAVVYNRTDGVLVANGISFNPFLKGMEDTVNNIYTIENTISPDYLNFLSNKVSVIKNDSNPPSISDLGSCSYQNTTGKCYQISDSETGILEAFVLSFFQDPNSGKYYLSVADAIPNIGAGKYFVDPNEFNNVFYICSGSCNNINTPKVVLPLYFLYKTAKGTYIYISSVVATVFNKHNLEGYFILAFNPADNSFEYYVTNTPTSKIRLRLGREVNNITFRYLWFDAYGGSGVENGYTISFASPDSVDFAIQKGNLLKVLFASDLAENTNELLVQ